MNNSLNKIAKQGKLSLGLVFPLEAYSGSIAKMENQEKLAKRAEELGFKSLWFRDVPFNDPSFGDAGQIFDPWIYMTHIMNQTKEITLASGSIILPLRHPVHTAKSALSLQNLSKGRFVMGVASGDRPIEYPAFNHDLGNKSELFRDSFAYIKALQGKFPQFQSKHYGTVNGAIDLLPKYPEALPMLVTGHSGQSLEWIAQNADGWLYYPRDMAFLKHTMESWNEALQKTNQPWKPYMQSLYLDLTQDKNANPSKIHLGFKSGVNFALSHLKMLESFGVNHVIINLKFATRPIEEVMEEIGESLIPHFN